MQEKVEQMMEPKNITPPSLNNMMLNQLRANRINNKLLLSLIETTARAKFLPEHLQSLAYCDHPLKLEHGRTLLPPLMLAQLLQVCAPQLHENCLVIGSGYGYGAALIAQMCQKVFCLENYQEFINQGEGFWNQFCHTHKFHSYRRLNFVFSSLQEGHPSAGPYDLILIEGAIQNIPNALLEQLKPQGRLVTFIRTNPVMEHMDLAYAYTFYKNSNNLEKFFHFEGSAPQLHEFNDQMGHFDL